MTNGILLKVFALVAYTLAMLGGAFGISYAVFEWRDEGAPSDCDLARETYYQGFITPDVDSADMEVLFEYLQENCQ